MDIFNGTLRQEESMFKIQVCSTVGCAIENLLHACDVFRMNPLENKFNGRFRRSVVLKDSKGFL